MIVDQQTLADILGKSTRTIRTWQREGMPAQGDRNERKYDTEEVIRWVAAYKIAEPPAQNGAEPDELPTAEEADRRWKAARAALRELELREKKGELVPIEVFREEIVELASRIRAIIDNWPGRRVPEVLAAETADELIQIRKEHARQLLDELRSFEESHEKRPKEEAT